MRLNWYKFPNDIAEEIKAAEGLQDEEDMIGGITVTRAKQLLRKYGGSAWTEHYDRDGGLFETTPITLAGNNSKFKYNRHL